MGPPDDRYGRRAKGNLEPAPVRRVGGPFVAALQRSGQTAQPPRNQAILVLATTNQGPLRIGVGRPWSPRAALSIAAAQAASTCPVTRPLEPQGSAFS